LVGIFACLVPLALPKAQEQPAMRSAQVAEQRAFNVPAGPLANTLTLFGQQAGLQVSVDPALLRGLMSPGVEGRMSAEQALDRLLVGTGLTHRIIGNTVTLERQRASSDALQLDPVRVQASTPPPTATIGTLPPPAPGGQVATGGREGFLGNRGYMDTPFSGTSYTSALIQNQQARTIADVVANDPSATKVGTSMFDTLRMRGFTVGPAAVSFDGLYGLVPEDRAPLEAYERVEVFKGPSAFLNGYIGAVGGTVNLVPKRASTVPITTIAASYATNAQLGAQADVGRRFGGDSQFGVRFNGIYRDGYAALQNSSERTGNAGLSLDYMGSNVRVAAHFGYTKQDTLAGNQLFFMLPGQAIPTAPNAFNAVQQPWETIDTEFFYGMGRVEVDLAHDWTAFAAYGQSFFREEWFRTIGTSLDSQGNFTASGNQFVRTFWKQTGEVGIRGRMSTGPVDHSLAMVATGYWDIAGSLFSALPFNVASNLYNPIFMYAPNVAAPDPNPAKTSATTLVSFALSDTLSIFGDRVQLMLGARNQAIQTTDYAETGAVANNYFATALSPAVGILLKPWSNVSIYGNYIEALNPGPTAPTTAVNAGEAFPPTQSKQFEIGAKVDFGQWSATAALFQITQPSGITDPATNIFSVDGKQVNQGIELNVFGQPFDGVRVLGGLMLLDARLAQTAEGTFNGNKAVGAPDVTIKFGVEWDTPFVRNLTLAGRVNYFSSQFIDEANTQSLSAYTLVSVGARYRFEVDRKPLAIRANIENLFNESAWASAFTGGLIYRGAPRTFYLSLTADF
jgi:iron complex outermembrane receptor protein